MAVPNPQFPSVRHLVWGIAVTIGMWFPLGLSAEEEPKHDMRQQLLKTFLQEFVEITPGEGKFPGTYKMGSEQESPVHEVTLLGPFSLSKYEVPQNLYEMVMGQNPSRWKGPRNSAEMMTWHEANEFCQKITQLLREEKLITQEQEIRLPSEGEWEYCCRAGTQTAYSFGDHLRKPEEPENQTSILDQYAWHTGNAAGNDPPVGALKPNPWGLYDMHGYLWEFVADDWHDDYRQAPKNSSPWIDHPPAKQTPIRGGSWRDESAFLRSTSRQSWLKTVRGDHIGFRCVLSSVTPGE